MSRGKEAARDLRYGRRGGAWAAPTSAHHKYTPDIEPVHTHKATKEPS